MKNHNLLLTVGIIVVLGVLYVFFSSDGSSDMKEVGVDVPPIADIVKDVDGDGDVKKDTEGSQDDKSSKDDKASDDKKD
ncbi:MAG: hypothetical protein CMF41_03765 [Legionellales bacterium]|nr:hypothetical protein [Legionellales bacterium]|tara:strand:- start:578 stop:814 length:237 start_codon:yes stop_codon:yes gene_type:complete